MDNRPIGFFDSGIGGLTSIPHLMRSLPNERIIFYGDTARTPYGSKSPDTIKEFSLQIGEFLSKKDVKMIVSACNTVSSTALDTLREAFPDIPVVGCITPTAKEVANLCESDERVAVMATKATINSGAYEKKILELRPDIKLLSKATPAIVPLIEEGIVDNEIMDLTIKYYLDEIVNEGIDTLVLGCTHYPLIRENLHRIYPDLKLISSSKAAAIAVEMELREKDILAEEGTGDNYFYASDLSDNFVRMIELVLGKDKRELNIEFQALDI